MQPHLRHWLMLGVLVAFWGSAFLLIKIAIASLSPESMVMIRLLAGFVTVLPFALSVRSPFPWDRTTLLQIGLIGLIGNLLPFWLVGWGQKTVPSSVSAILMTVTPFVILGLAHFFMPGERLTRRKVLGFAAGFVGVLVLIGPGALESAAGEPRLLLRELAILGGAVAYGVTTILTPRAPNAHPYVISAAVLFAASLLMAPFAAGAFLSELKAASLPSLVAAVALGVFATGIGNIVYFHLIRTAGAGFFAVAHYLNPLWATVLGVTFGHEPFTAALVLALVLILGGVAVSQSRARAVN